MNSILHIDSSLFGENGQSGLLSKQFVEKYTQANPGTPVIYRDLGSDPVPHLNAESFQGFMLTDDERNKNQKAIAALSEQLISELKDSDILVLGLPMYNFSLPSTLKAYFDHIARAGITFRYTENGPAGLLEGKKTYVFAARGGFYKGTEMDTQTDFIRHFLAFTGITDVEFVYAEGLSKSDDGKDQSLNTASEAIDQLVA